MHDYLICSTNALNNGQSKGFSAHEQDFFIVNDNDTFYVYLNACPHLGVNLHWQEDVFLDSDNELIQCATHNALFTIDSGECIYGPCQGEHLKKASSYESGGNLYLEIPPIITER